MNEMLQQHHHDIQHRDLAARIGQDDLDKLRRELIASQDQSNRWTLELSGSTSQTYDSNFQLNSAQAEYHNALLQVVQQTTDD